MKLASLPIFFRPVLMITLVLSICLVVLGGVVHNTGSSLACPDWPLCFGLFFPDMVGGVAIEHSHRLLGALVGLFTLINFIAVIRLRKTSLSRFFNLSLGLLVIVIFQGVLGGITVLMKLSPEISTLHLATSQIFIGLLYYTFSISKKTQTAKTVLPQTTINRLRTLLVLLFLQMVLGAYIRHSGSASTCGLGPDAWFLCRGDDGVIILWPDILAIQLNVFHRYFAVILAGLFFLWLKPLLSTAKAKAVLLEYLFIVLQILLGIFTLYSYIGIYMITLHLLVAALLWLNLIKLNLQLRASTI